LETGNDVTFRFLVPVFVSASFELYRLSPTVTQLVEVSDLAGENGHFGLKTGGFGDIGPLKSVSYRLCQIFQTFSSFLAVSFTVVAKV
jgi:hypothetical protein